MARRVPNPWTRRVTRKMWLAAAFFLAGYLPALVGSPPLGMGLATGLMIPVGMRARTVVRGALTGAIFGLLAALAMTGAWRARWQGMTMAAARTATQPATGPAATSAPTTAPTTLPAPLDIGPYVKLFLVGTIAPCTAVGALLALLAQRRRRRIEQEWKDDPFTEM